MACAPGYEGCPMGLVSPASRSMAVRRGRKGGRGSGGREQHVPCEPSPWDRPCPVRSFLERPPITRRHACVLLLANLGAFVPAAAILDGVRDAGRTAFEEENKNKKNEKRWASVRFFHVMSTIFVLEPGEPAAPCTGRNGQGLPGECLCSTAGFDILIRCLCVNILMRPRSDSSSRPEASLRRGIGASGGPHRTSPTGHSTVVNTAQPTALLSATNADRSDPDLDSGKEDRRAHTCTRARACSRTQTDRQTDKHRYAGQHEQWHACDTSMKPGHSVDECEHYSTAYTHAR